MARYCIKFSKEGYLKYTSHLDMVRLFKRLFKRADIHLEYSNGFNPHPKMGIAQPLSLGYTGKAELLEMETKEEMDPEEIKGRLNEIMPTGMQVSQCFTLIEGGKSLAAQCKYAIYSLTFPKEYQFLKDENFLKGFLNQKEIIVQKKKKKSKELKPVDIKELIQWMKIEEGEGEGEHIVIKINVATGSQGNLSPSLVIQGLSLFSMEEIETSKVEISRESLEL